MFLQFRHLKRIPYIRGLLLQVHSPSSSPFPEDLLAARLDSERFDLRSSIPLPYFRRREQPVLSQMCHRKLRFIKSRVCGHLTFIGDMKVDCRSVSCYLSAAHPPSCGSTLSPCYCRRYFEQPERIIDAVDGNCSECNQRT
ncbi:hypothetical protein BD779DRAFT_852489 [Infundibulicybe gibba]|nr:hypothetical protein BD779DRAFT_852489 [Infundibulicybe gibba]